jgi:hypothetical protein
VLTAAAVCPHPPALIPEVGGGALADVATRAVAVVQRLVRTAPDVIVVAGGPDPHLGRRCDETSVHRPEWLGASAGGTTDRFGLRLSIGGVGPGALPLPGLVGCWLLDRAGWTGPRRYLTVPPGFPAAEGAGLGAALANGDAHVALLAMGDGSSSRTGTSPAAFRPEAVPFDDEAFSALTEPDPDRLLALDGALAAHVGAAGLSAWQVLAGAVAAAGDPGTWGSEAAEMVTTTGVAYLLVFLRPRGSDRVSVAPGS